jgi:hypothetical protein
MVAAAAMPSKVDTRYDASPMFFRHCRGAQFDVHLRFHVKLHDVQMNGERSLPAMASGYSSSAPMRWCGPGQVTQQDVTSLGMAP